jgi:hypothetical protein
MDLICIVIILLSACLVVSSICLGLLIWKFIEMQRQGLLEGPKKDKDRTAT